MKSTAYLHDAAMATVETMLGHHQRLVDALGTVLRLHYENSAAEPMMEALDELVECTKNSLLDDPIHKSLLGSAHEATQSAEREDILKRMSELRRQVEQSEQCNLLPQLIYIDHWLTNQISSEILAVLYSSKSAPLEKIRSHIKRSISHFTAIRY